MTTAAIITAAGRGTRAGGDLPKQWQMLAGRPVVAHAMAAFAHMPRVLVVHGDDLARAQDLGSDALIVIGGATRGGSVRAGLEALAGRGIDRVLIHDGARPLVSGRLRWWSSRSSSSTRGLPTRLTSSPDRSVSCWGCRPRWP